MPNYVWKASFVLTGAKCNMPFKKREWFVENVGSSNNVHKVRFTKVFEEIDYRDYWKVYCQFEDEIDKLLNASAAGLFFNINITNFPTVSDVELTLQNTAELVKAQQKIPFRTSLTFRFNLVFTDQTLDTVLQSLSKIDASQNRDKINHCLHLFRQGLSYSDLFDRFFTLWRAFNSLYNFYSSKRGESSRIVDTLCKLDMPDTTFLVETFSNIPNDCELAVVLAPYKYNLFNYLIGMNLTDEHGNDRSKELAQAVSSGKSEDFIKCTVLCLYVLRCNYAHGSDSQIMQNQEVFKVSSSFLTILLSCIINKLA